MNQIQQNPSSAPAVGPSRFQEAYGTVHLAIFSPASSTADDRALCKAAYFLAKNARDALSENVPLVPMGLRAIKKHFPENVMNAMSEMLRAGIQQQGYLTVMNAPVETLAGAAATEIKNVSKIGTSPIFEALLTRLSACNEQQRAEVLALFGENRRAAFFPVLAALRDDDSPERQSAALEARRYLGRRGAVLYPFACAAEFRLRDRADAESR